MTAEATSNRLITTNAGRGTTSYRAPELLKESKSGFNSKSDMWSLGCIAFELFTGEHAFASDYQTMAHAISKKTPRNIVKDLSPFAKLIIRALLQTDPGNRPAARDLLAWLILPNPTVHIHDRTEEQSRKRRRGLPSSWPFSAHGLLKESLEWALSNEQPGLFLLLRLAQMSTPTNPHAIPRGNVVESPDPLKLFSTELIGEKDGWNSTCGVLDLNRAAKLKHFNLTRIIVNGVRSQRVSLRSVNQSSSLTGIYDLRVLELLSKMGFNLTAKNADLLEALYSALDLEPRASDIISKFLPSAFIKRCGDCVAICRPLQSSLGLTSCHTSFTQAGLVPILNVPTAGFSPDGRFFYFPGSIRLHQDADSCLMKFVTTRFRLFRSRVGGKVHEIEYVDKLLTANMPVGSCLNKDPPIIITISPNCISLVQFPEGRQLVHKFTEESNLKDAQVISSHDCTLLAYAALNLVGDPLVRIGLLIITESGTMVEKWTLRSRRVLSLAFSPDDRYLFVLLCSCRWGGAILRFGIVLVEHTSKASI